MIHGFAFRFTAASWDTFNAWHVVRFRAQSSGHKSGMIDGTGNIALKRHKPSRNWIKRRSKRNESPSVTKPAKRRWNRRECLTMGNNEVATIVQRARINRKWTIAFRVPLLIYQVDETFLERGWSCSIRWWRFHGRKNRCDSLFYAIVLRDTRVPRSPRVLVKFTRTVHRYCREGNQTWKLHFFSRYFHLTVQFGANIQKFFQKCKKSLNSRRFIRPSGWTNFISFIYFVCINARVIFNLTLIHH